ncbi:hypothetical protein VH567_07150 [Sphingomonas sp. 4RDLI-65]|uniref:hypothetical protein n=1 Tax=Sphingomonas sp. 4RDLI-65 TaxID=3111641 RepID=UPI003C2153F7
MMRIKAPIFAIAGIVAVTGTAYALQLSPETIMEASRGMTRLVGMSPAGTEMWVRLSVARGGKQDLGAFDRIDREIGEQLAFDTPDKAKLAMLARAYATEQAKFELNERNGMIADALRLSVADRKILGRFLVRSRTRDGPPTPVVAPLP